MEMTLNDILSEDEKGILVLPDFQREFVWKAADQKSLIAAFLVQIPINSMLLLEGNRDDFAEKRMCWRTNQNTESAKTDVRRYLLDGQQRLSTLKNAFSDLFRDEGDWMDQLKSLESRLNLRWFLDFTPDEEDVFGLRTLRFPEGDRAINKLEPSVIESRLKSFSLYKKNANEWYAPGAPKDDFFRQTAAQKLLPLYQLYRDEKHVTTDILTEIAMERMNEIRAGWENMPADFKEEMLGILCEIDSAAEKWKTQTPQMDMVWMKCSNKLAITWSSSMQSYLTEVLNQELTFIKLEKDEINRAIVIFENLNNSGTALSTYDLVVARAAKCGEYPSLTERVMKMMEENAGSEDKDGKFSLEKIGILDPNSHRMTATFQKWYLDLLALCIEMPEMKEIKKENIREVENEISVLFKRGSILNLGSKAIHEKSELVIRSLLRAVTFLNQRCGLLRIDQLSYKLMVLPIAYLMRDENILQDKKKLDRMEYWYWVSIFSGRYITNQNRRCAEDTAWLYQYVERQSDFNPFADDAHDVLARKKYSDFATLLHPEAVNPVVSNGLFAYVLSKHPHDFYRDKTIELRAERIANNEEIFVEASGKTLNVPLKLELHHIIPLGTSKTMKNVTSDLRKDKRNLLNSPLNLTYISSLANKFIGAQSPQVYLDNLYAGSITDHFIPARPKDFKVEADQKKFLEGRYHLLLQDLQQHLQELCQ